MPDLVLHDQTKQQIERFLQQRMHALLLVGPAGSGKQAVARLIAGKILGTGPDDVHDNISFKVVQPDADKNSIGIEAIRELQQFTKLKLPDSSASRVIYIDGAQQLTTEAQNAFLKMLEEPPVGTFFILTTVSEQQLLPTIRSRVQHLIVHRPDRHAVEEFFIVKGYDAKDIGQAYFLSGGLPGMLSALLEDTGHPLKQTVQTARQLLQMTQFERLGQVDALAKNKPETMQLLHVLQLMARTALQQTADKATATNTPADRPIRQWYKILRASYEAERAYAASAQAKLTLTNLMLSL